MSQERELVNKILDSIDTIISLDKKRIVTFEGRTFHPSELQLLIFIYFVQDTNITAIAEKMDLTKGAVSQTLSRLQKKGIIKKETYPAKKNELKVQFTDKGEKLMAILVKDKKSIERKLQRYLKTLSPEEKSTISDFLDRVVKIMS